MELTLGGHTLALPISTLLLVAASVAVASYVLISLISKMLNPKAPPVLSCLPLIGGILKFVKVRAGAGVEARTVWPSRPGWPAGHPGRCPLRALRSARWRAMPRPACGVRAMDMG